MDRLRHLKKGETVLVTGPARITLKTGRVRIAGTDRSRYIVKEGRTCTIEGVQESDVVIVLGSNAKIEEYTMQPPRMWLKYAHDLLQKKGVVMVMGAPDTGKTTFTTFLANQALKKGMSVAVIDSDIGQSDIGPPSTIGLAFVNHEMVRLSEIPADESYFVGAISVDATTMCDMVVGLTQLVNRARERAEMIIVDTCGYVLGDTGRKLKMLKLESIDPDFLVALQKKDELYPILRTFDKEIIKVDVPGHARRISRYTRREIRNSKWKRTFEKAKERQIDLEEKRLLNTYLLSGSPVNTDIFRKLFQCRILHAEQIPEGFFIVRKDIAHEYSSPPVSISGNTVRMLDAGWEKDLVVGLISEGHVVDLGIMKRINYKNMMAQILCAEHEFDTIKFGRIKVTESGSEAGFLKWC